MPAPAWENLDVFVNPDDFGVPVVIDLQDGGTRELVGIFDDPFLNAQLGEYEPDTSQPRVTAKTSDLAGVRRGDIATVHGREYDVMAVEPDGTGMAVMRMAARG